MDIHAKQIVVAFPFKGEKLFGEPLDEILVETRDKKQAMPRRLTDRKGHGSYSFRGQSHYQTNRNKPDSR